MNEQRPLGASPKHPFIQWWSSHVATSVDRPAVVENVHADSGWSGHYVFMTMMSAGIAVLGLLLSSPAVVIGAMLISPLMGPIIGFGFALAVFDAAEIKRTLQALLLGVALAVAFCAFIVLVSPLQTVTDEIAARTRPNLFDLLVALFSGLAGTYAMIRGRHGTIVGVAIATALMPPLAVIGFGVATANWTVFGGATLLFLTNLMTIAVSAAILARIYGFAGHLSPRQTGLQATLVIGTFVALGIPLLVSLKQIAWETLASRQARDVIASHFGEQSRLSEISINYDAEPLGVTATVLTPQIRSGAEQATERKLTELLRRPVDVSIDQFRVGGEEDAEVAEIAVARGAIADRSRAQLAERLALVAGVAPDEVLVDRTNRRALVRAAPLPGANYESYRALEGRVAAAEPDWTVALVPPPLPLPGIAFEDEEPDAAGAQALATAIWAASRLGLGVRISGPAERTERIAAAFAAAKVETSIETSDSRSGVSLEWMTPGTDGAGTTDGTAARASSASASARGTE